MALKKLRPFLTLEQLQKNYEDSCIAEICVRCSKQKPIPVIRAEKVCDDCIDGEDQAQKTEQSVEASNKRKAELRIPSRFWNYDFKKMEISQSDFEDLCEPGRSIAISGEIETGKTALGCQILATRNHGSYYFITEIFAAGMINKIMDNKLLMIDDITKMDTKHEKQIEKLFELLNYRYANCLDTIITTDRGYDDMPAWLGDNWGPALVRRFRGWMIGVVLKNKYKGSSNNA